MADSTNPYWDEIQEVFGPNGTLIDQGVGGTASPIGSPPVPSLTAAASMPWLVVSGQRVYEGTNGPRYRATGYDSYVMTPYYSPGGAVRSMTAAQIDVFMSQLRPNSLLRLFTPAPASGVTFQAALADIDVVVAAAVKYGQRLALCLTMYNGSLNDAFYGPGGLGTSKTAAWFTGASPYSGPMYEASNFNAYTSTTGQSYQDWVTLLATHYTKTPNVSAYDICNEPQDFGGAMTVALTTFASTASGWIKACAPNALVYMGIQYPTAVGSTAAYQAINGVLDFCSAHDYDALGYVGKGLVAAQAAAAINKPCLIDEFGVWAKAQYGLWADTDKDTNNNPAVSWDAQAKMVTTYLKSAFALDNVFGALIWDAQDTDDGVLITVPSVIQASTTTVTVASGGFPGVSIGQNVQGPNVAPGTTVKSISGNSLVMSVAAQASATVTLNFGGWYTGIGVFTPLNQSKTRQVIRTVDLDAVPFHPTTIANLNGWIDASHTVRYAPTSSVGGPNVSGAPTAMTNSGAVISVTATNVFVSGSSVTFAGIVSTGGSPAGTLQTLLNGLTFTVSGTGLSSAGYQITAAGTPSDSWTSGGIATPSTVLNLVYDRWVGTSSNNYRQSNATLAPTAQQAVVPGGFPSLQFNGSQWISVPAWVLGSETSGVNQQNSLVFVGAVTAYPGHGYAFLLAGSGADTFAVAINASGNLVLLRYGLTTTVVVATSSNVLTLNTLHEIEVRWDGTTSGVTGTSQLFSIYVDGVQVASGSQALTMHAASSIMVGSAPVRVDAAAGTTLNSATVTDAAILASDFGKAVSGTNIPVPAYVGTVTSGTSFLLSASATQQINLLATGTGTVSATLTPTGFSGHICDLLHFTSYLSDAERSRINGYLDNKYGGFPQALPAAATPAGASRLAYKSSQAVVMGVSSAYGVPTSFVPDAPAVGIVALYIYVTWGGTYASETTVMNFVVTFNDGTTVTSSAQLSATAVGNVSEAAVTSASWLKDGCYVTGITAAAQTNKATSTAVTCTMNIAGLNVN